MDALEKSKLALRKYLLENKEKVTEDLKSMREKSEGNDIFKYVDNMSNAFSLCEVSSNEVLYDYSFNEIENYDFYINELLSETLYSPPDSNKSKKTKKDPENIPGSFFFVIL